MSSVFLEHAELKRVDLALVSLSVGCHLHHSSLQQRNGLCHPAANPQDQWANRVDMKCLVRLVSYS